MLAQSAASIDEALAATGVPAAVDAKLDGIRIQVHRDGDDVAVFSRSLDDITARVPEIVAVARALPARTAVLDGEALALDAAGRARPFQETASRAGRFASSVADARSSSTPCTSTAPTSSTSPAPCAGPRSTTRCRPRRGSAGRWSTRPPRPRPPSPPPSTTARKVW